MSKIIIASHDETVDLLDNNEYNEKVTAIVSISDHSKASPSVVRRCQEKKDKVVLTLHFDDMEREMLDNPRCSGWEPPQMKHIQAIISRSKEILNSGGWILCHCQAGISRSAAAAFILKCIELGPGKEEEALGILVKSRDYISPNKWMVEMAQEILGDEWDLIDALKNIQYIRLVVKKMGNPVVESVDSMLKNIQMCQLLGGGK